MKASKQTRIPMNYSARSLHSIRVTRRPHSVRHRDDCHQPLLPCLSLRWVHLSHHLQKGKNGRMGWRWQLLCQTLGCSKWAWCPIFSVRVADRVHINTCETGKPQLWQSLLAQDCVIHFLWHWHRGVYTLLPHCCVTEGNFCNVEGGMAELLCACVHTFLHTTA